MKITLFKYQDQVRYGVIKENKVIPLSGDIFGAYEESAEEIPLNDVELQAPIQPRKLICVGLNYALHAKETNKQIPEEPMIFMCSPSAIIGPNETIHLNNQEDPIDYEAELVIVIGKKGRTLLQANIKNMS